ncbi:hypothetical protein TNCV_763801 [Trichonephila clavipes]|nr:hypothetical protein TNCV_763801 [Trichonephila clavipes]
MASAPLGSWGAYVEILPSPSPEYIPPSAFHSAGSRELSVWRGYFCNVFVPENRQNQKNMLRGVLEHDTKHPLSSPDPTAPKSASLSTIPDGRLLGALTVVINDLKIVAFPARPRQALLEKDLVTWQAMVGRHILEDIVGRVAQYVDEHYPVDKWHLGDLIAWVAQSAKISSTYLRAVKVP